jgi:hypothetical protein
MMSKGGGEEAKYVMSAMCGRSARGAHGLGMVHSSDCSYAQLQCRQRQGLKRRGSFSDVSPAMSPVKVEEIPSSESLQHKLVRSFRKPSCLELLRSGAPATPDVSCTQGQARNEGDVHVRNGASHGSEDSALQAELRRSGVEQLLATQGQRNVAEMRLMVHRATQVRTIEAELQAELWRTKEEIKVARKQRDEAVAGKQVQLERQCDQVYEIEMMLQMELQKARRELRFVYQQRDDALQELDSQAQHQQEQVAQIERELQGELQRTLAEIQLVRKQRDDAIIAKHAQLEQQCDAVYEIEMSLQMQLRRLLIQLESARKEHQAAVLEVHLQQEHQHQQVHQIEMELQGKIQIKSEELKVVQKERDKAISETHSQLELQSDQVTQVEMQLQRDLQQVLDELHNVQERQNPLPPLDLHLDQAREIEEALVLSREKLNCLKQQQRTTAAGEAKKPAPEFPRSRGIRSEKQNLNPKPLQTPKEALKVS